MKDDGGPAFPSNLANYAISNGMSLRDWFAGQALTGLLADPVSATLGAQEKAKFCFAVADAMLAAREK